MTSDKYLNSAIQALDQEFVDLLEKNYFIQFKDWFPTHFEQLFNTGRTHHLWLQYNWTVNNGKVFYDA